MMRAFVKDYLKKFHIRTRNNQKVFCIGLGKTGTTSLKKVLRDFGYILGHQQQAERLIHSYAIRDFQPIIEYCKKAEAFQDLPFGLPFTYVVMDQYFPGSKFILSVRNDADEWYNSLVNFHSKKFGKGKKPSKEDLEKFGYNYRGGCGKPTKSFTIRQRRIPIEKKH